MEWVWNNKGAIVTTAVLAKFIQNPQPFIDGTVKVADVATDKLAKPVATRLAASIATSTNWTSVIIAVIAAVSALTLSRSLWGRLWGPAAGSVLHRLKSRAAQAAEITPEEMPPVEGEPIPSQNKGLRTAWAKAAHWGRSLVKKWAGKLRQWLAALTISKPKL